MMLHGGRVAEVGTMAEMPSAGRAPLRKIPSTITPGGLLRKTVYFSQAEWQAIRRKAFEEDRAYTDIVREAIRRMLGLADEPD
jgi:hypothetical protein